MPTRRGIGVLVVALGAYLGGRLVGTYELYIVALALAALVVLSWALVLLTGTRLRIERDVRPTLPSAGDRVEMSLTLRNRSLLPTAPLRVTQTLGGLSNQAMVLDASPLPPRAVQRSYLDLPGLRRGRFELPPPRVTVVDPLGIARRHVAVGDPLELTVLPAIARLRSCVFFGGRELGLGRRARLSHASASLDLRGVRPHQPGEPLSRIDWKSTAKVGALMLKEMEEPGRTDVVLILDGTDRMHVGEPPEDSFELAAAATGSLGDYVLREGFGLTLLLHGDDDAVVRVETGDRGHWELLLALAEVESDAVRPVAEAIDDHHTLVSRGLAVVVVTTDTGKDLMHRLIDLRDKGTPVYLVHVDPASFGLERHESRVDIRGRSFLLELQHHGIPSLTVRRGDDLAHVLAFADDRGAEGTGAPRAVAGGDRR